MTSLFVGANGGVAGTTTTTASQTTYAMVANSMLSFSFSTEGDAQFPCVPGGTFSGMSVMADTNGSTNATTINFRNNGAGGNQTVSISGGVTGTFTDSTHSDVVSAGNKYCLQQVTGSGTVSFRANAVGMAFASGGADGFPLATINTSGQNVIRTIRYFCAPGIASLSTTEGSRQGVILAHGATNFYVRLSSNNNNVGSSATLRKNGAASNLAVSIGAGVSGSFQDTTHSDSFADNDLVDVQYDDTGSSTGLVTFVNAGWWATPSASVQNVSTGQNSSVIGSSSQYFVPTVGNAVAVTTESQAQVPVRAASTWGNIALNVSGTFGGSGGTLTSRVNGSNGNQSVSIGSGVTGIFRDSTHTDSLSVGDKICLGVLPLGGAGGGQFKNSYSAFVASAPASNPGWFCLPAFI